MAAGGKAAHVHAACEARCIKRNAVSSDALEVIHECPDLSAKQIVHLQRNLPVRRHLVGNHRGRVERVGVVLAECEESTTPFLSLATNPAI